MKTAQQVSEQFGIPIEQIKAQYSRNAKQLRQMARTAGNGIYRGKTAVQWALLARHAEQQSK